jgi:hypothetical protein
VLNEVDAMMADDIYSSAGLRHMIRAVRLRPLLALAVLLALAGCGSSSTKTVTRIVPRPATTTTGAGTTGATTPATSTPATSPAASTPATSTPATSTAATTPPATGSEPSTPGTSTAAPVYFQGVTARGAQRPASLELTGDGTLFVHGVQWASWGGPVATGTGNAEYHGCTPNCAAAVVHQAFVAIRLSGVRTCSGRNYYSSATLKLNSGQLLDKQFMQRSWSPC